MDSTDYVAIGDAGASGAANSASGTPSISSFDAQHGRIFWTFLGNFQCLPVPKRCVFVYRVYCWYCVHNSIYCQITTGLNNSRGHFNDAVRIVTIDSQKLASISSSITAKRWLFAKYQVIPVQNNTHHNIIIQSNTGFATWSTVAYIPHSWFERERKCRGQRTARFSKQKPTKITLKQGLNTIQHNIHKFPLKCDTKARENEMKPSGNDWLGSQLTDQNYTEIQQIPKIFLLGRVYWYFI